MRRQLNLSHKTRRAGSVIVLVAVSLVALIGAAAFVFDLGRLTIAAQYAQRTADASALAGLLLPMKGVTGPAIARANSVVTANGPLSPYQLAVPPSGITVYGPGQTPPGYRVLGAGEEALRVIVRGTVAFNFAAAFGLQSAPVQRAAVAARVNAAGGTFVPMFIDSDTPVVYGQLTQLRASTAGEVLPPGNFGFLEPLAGSFRDLLGGQNLTPALAQANFVTVGDTLNATTGQRTGQWEQELRGRLQRATVPPYDLQTPTIGGYTNDNPRILLIPMVEYISGTGGGASYEVVRFGVFWLEDLVGGKQKSIQGRFIEFTVPLSPDTTGNTGLLVVRLVS